MENRGRNQVSSGKNNNKSNIKGDVRIADTLWEQQQQQISKIDSGKGKNEGIEQQQNQAVQQPQAKMERKNHHPNTVVYVRKTEEHLLHKGQVLSSQTSKEIEQTFKQQDIAAVTSGQKGQRNNNKMKQSSTSVYIQKAAQLFNEKNDDSKEENSYSDLRSSTNSLRKSGINNQSKFRQLKETQAIADGDSTGLIRHTRFADDNNTSGIAGQDQQNHSKLKRFQSEIRSNRGQQEQQQQVSSKVVYIRKKKDVDQQVLKDQRINEINALRLNNIFLTQAVAHREELEKKKKLKISTLTKEQLKAHRILLESRKNHSTVISTPLSQIVIKGWDGLDDVEQSYEFIMRKRDSKANSISSQNSSAVNSLRNSVAVVDNAAKEALGQIGLGQNDQMSLSERDQSNNMNNNIQSNRSIFSKKEIGQDEGKGNWKNMSLKSSSNNIEKNGDTNGNQVMQLEGNNVNVRFEDSKTQEIVIKEERNGRNNHVQKLANEKNKKAKLKTTWVEKTVGQNDIQKDEIGEYQQDVKIVDDKVIKQIEGQDNQKEQVNQVLKQDKSLKGTTEENNRIDDYEKDEGKKGEDKITVEVHQVEEEEKQEKKMDYYDEFEIDLEVDNVKCKGDKQERNEVELQNAVGEINFEEDGQEDKFADNIDSKEQMSILQKDIECVSDVRCFQNQEDNLTGVDGLQKSCTNKEEIVVVSQEAEEGGQEKVIISNMDGTLSDEMKDDLQKQDVEITLAKESSQGQKSQVEQSQETHQIVEEQEINSANQQEQEEQHDKQQDQQIELKEVIDQQQEFFQEEEQQDVEFVMNQDVHKHEEKTLQSVFQGTIPFKDEEKEQEKVEKQDDTYKEKIIQIGDEDEETQIITAVNDVGIENQLETETQVTENKHINEKVTAQINGEAQKGPSEQQSCSPNEPQSISQTQKQPQKLNLVLEEHDISQSYKGIIPPQIVVSRTASVENECTLEFRKTSIENNDNTLHQISSINNEPPSEICHNTNKLEIKGYLLDIHSEGGSLNASMNHLKHGEGSNDNEDEVISQTAKTETGAFKLHRSVFLEEFTASIVSTDINHHNMIMDNSKLEASSSNLFQSAHQTWNTTQLEQSSVIGSSISSSSLQGSLQSSFNPVQFAGYVCKRIMLQTLLKKGHLRLPSKHSKVFLSQMK